MLGIIAHMIVYVVKLATGVYMLPLAIILHASLTAGLIAFIEDNLKDEPESFW
jgi:hypothetical protein